MLKQTLQQKLLQKLSPQQIQLMKLLQLPTMALEQRIKQEIEENPALEEGSEQEEKAQEEEEETDISGEDADEENDDRSSERDEFDAEDYFDDEDEIAQYKLQTKNTGPDEDRREIPFVSIVTFKDVLENQLALRELDNRQYQIGLYLIGNIDDDGYLRRELSSIVDDIAFSQNIETNEEELDRILKIIQEFDPAGVGARDLRECLLIQLERKEPKTHTIQLAQRVVAEMMKEFSRKHYDKIARNLNIQEPDLKTVIDEILKLNPRPGNTLSETQRMVQDVVPDFIVYNHEGELEVVLNSRNSPDLCVSQTYSQMLDEYGKNKSKSGKEAYHFVKQKVDAARWFIDALEQRQQTLLLTMRAVVDHQRDFFLTGDETMLKPMILKDISEKVKLDISTISRVSNSKYVQTSFGTYLLKFFFSEALTTDDGEEVSSREVKKILSNCVENEDKRKPLTDEKLMDILKEKGYNIARRTVAKYREMLGIPVARLRKKL